MQFREEEVLLGGNQKMEAVGVPGGWDDTSEPLCLCPDDLLLQFANKGGKVQINDACPMIARAFLEGTPRGESNWQFLGDPDTANG